MQFYTHFDNYIKVKNAVVTVGTFDGLHKGHIKILEMMKDIASGVNGSTIMVTFEPHPRSVVANNYDLIILTSLGEKKKIVEEIGIDQLFVLNFTRDFSDLTSEEFIKKYIVEKFGAVHMVVGHDHKFGKDRLGDEEKLRELGKKYGFEVTSVPAEKMSGEIISSTKIRNLLLEGDIDKANLLLARNYSLSGTVVKGAQRGRLLGFPTANVKLFDPLKAIPMNGVYVVSCNCSDQKLFGIMNVGYRPTFENKSELVIEVHLLNFDRDIYGEELTINFMTRLRDEKKFSSKEELIHQIEDDKKRALELINILNN